MDKPRIPRTCPKRQQRIAWALGLGAALLVITACSSQVAHPLLTDDVKTRVKTVNLETPPAVGEESPPGDTPPPDSAPAKVDAATPAMATNAGEVEPAGKEAGERLELTVADVRSEAISNNLEIKTELVRPSLLKQDRLEAEARFLPTAFARYTYSDFDAPGLPPTRAPNDSTTVDGEVGLQIPLQTGGTAQISMPVTRTDFGVPDVDIAYDAAASLSLSQPLLRDAGRKVNLAPITVARLLERQQDASTKLAILNVLAGADRFYWNLYAATRTVEVRLEQYARAQEQERQATRLADEGVVPAIEIVRARSGVARRIDDIIRAENARRQVEREVKRAMNRADLPVSGATALIVTSRPNPARIVIDRKAALATAAQNRMELLALELQLAADSLSVDVARNQKLPRLALDYTFRYLGVGNKFSRALDLLGSQDFADQSIGLTLEVPLGNQARVARYEKAVLLRALDLATREQQYQLIERQVLDTIDQLEEAWQRILAARQETLLAAHNFQAEQRQFILGVRTSTDVLIAADFLAEAQIRELDALSTYEIAKIDTAFVTGTLLGDGRIELATFDETHDLDAAGDLDVDSITSSAASSAEPAQESIAEKLKRLGVKPPNEQETSGPQSSPPPSPAPAKPPSDLAPPSSSVQPPAETREAPLPAAAESAPPMLPPVTAQDTLWSLAGAHRPDRQVSVQQMMSALMRANPAQFPTGDPSSLRVGVVLRLPTPSELADAHH